jgi:hypothetical protein
LIEKKMGWKKKERIKKKLVNIEACSFLLRRCKYSARSNNFNIVAKIHILLLFNFEKLFYLALSIVLTCCMLIF